MPADLRPIARAALCLTEAPFLKHYRCGRFRLWNGVGMSTSELPGPGFNFAAAVDPCPPLDAILAAGRDFFAGCEYGWGVLVEGGVGHPVEAEMIARGWAVAEDEPAFVLAELPPAPPTASPGLTLRPVRTADDLRTFQNICTAAYNAPPKLADAVMPSLSFALDPDMWWVIGERDGEPVAVGGYTRSGPTAVIGCLGTLEAHRGRGVGAAVCRAALAHAAADGCTAAVLRSGPKSVPLYERLGFRYVCRHRTYAVPG
jgi:GNAT superfamily N-acetyltransferase